MGDRSFSSCLRPYQQPQHSRDSAEPGPEPPAARPVPAFLIASLAHWLQHGFMPPAVRSGLFQVSHHGAGPARFSRLDRRPGPFVPLPRSAGPSRPVSAVGHAGGKPSTERRIAFAVRSWLEPSFRVRDSPGLQKGVRAPSVRKPTVRMPAGGRSDPVLRRNSPIFKARLETLRIILASNPPCAQCSPTSQRILRNETGSDPRGQHCAQYRVQRLSKG